MQTIATVSLNGVEHRWTKRGAATADDWWHYMCGADNLFASGRFDAIVVDNCRVHHAVDQQMAVRQLCMPLSTTISFASRHEFRH